MKMTMFRKSGMRAATLGLCTTVLCAIPVIAQNTAPPSMPSMGGQGVPGNMQGRRVEMLASELALTPDQVTQVKEIDKDEIKQTMALRNGTLISPEDRRAKMMDIHKATTDKIRSILTEDQKTKYDALQAEMKERRQGAGAPQPAPPR